MRAHYNNAFNIVSHYSSKEPDHSEELYVCNMLIYYKTKNWVTYMGAVMSIQVDLVNLILALNTPDFIVSMVDGDKDHKKCLIRPNMVQAMLMWHTSKLRLDMHMVEFLANIYSNPNVSP